MVRCRASAAVALSYRSLLVLLVLGGCATDEHCPGGDVDDPGPARDLADPLDGWDRDPEAPGVVTLGSGMFRVEDDQLVVQGGATLPLADDFTVDCRGVDALSDARFGVTFTADENSGEVVRADCHYCA